MKYTNITHHEEFGQQKRARLTKTAKNALHVSQLSIPYEKPDKTS